MTMTIDQAMLAVRRATSRFPVSIPPLEGAALLVLILIWGFGA